MVPVTGLSARNKLPPTVVLCPRSSRCHMRRRTEDTQNRRYEGCIHPRKPKQVERGRTITPPVKKPGGTNSCGRWTVSVCMYHGNKSWYDDTMVRRNGLTRVGGLLERNYISVKIWIHPKHTPHLPYIYLDTPDVFATHLVFTFLFLLCSRMVGTSTSILDERPVKLRVHKRCMCRWV